VEWTCFLKMTANRIRRLGESKPRWGGGSTTSASAGGCEAVGGVLGGVAAAARSYWQWSCSIMDRILSSSDFSSEATPRGAGPSGGDGPMPDPRPIPSEDVDG